MISGVYLLSISPGNVEIETEAVVVCIFKMKWIKGSSPSDIFFKAC